MLFLLVGILLAVNVGGYTPASVFFGNALRKVPVYYVATDKKQVAISFDAAWGADKTAKIVEICNQFNVKATFFLVGMWVEKYPDMVKLIDDNGFEIGTHSNTHPDMTKLNVEKQSLELTTSINLINNITGKYVKIFRAPFGAYNDTLISTAESLNLLTIQWDVDSLDWKGIGAMEITNRVLNGVRNGSIILCHNNSDHILDALPRILDELTAKGYQFVTVGELIYTDHYTIDAQGVQHKNI